MIALLRKTILLLLVIAAFFHQELFAQKIVVQDGVDGGNTRGIFMWKADDPNWGIYMSQSGAGKSLSGGTATGAAGFDGHALRLRVSNTASQGFIFENMNEENLFSIRGSDGLAYFKGVVGIGTTAPDPQFRMHLVGNIKVSGATATDGYAVVSGGTATNAGSVGIFGANRNLLGTIGFGPSQLNYTATAGNHHIFRGGNMGIGLTTTELPTAQLHTTGSVRFAGAGTPGAGKVLQSDAEGNATWQDIPSGPGNGGQKIVVQNKVDGGNSRGIFMWGADDPTWGIYFASPGPGKSLSNGNATAGAGFNLHAMRFRGYAASVQGFIFENTNEENLFSIRGNDGLAYFRGSVGLGTQSPAAQLHTTGSVRFAGAGTPGQGKVLQSDALGNASWQDPIAASLNNAGQKKRILASDENGNLTWKNIEDVIVDWWFYDNDEPDQPENLPTGNPGIAARTAGNLKDPLYYVPSKIYANSSPDQNAKLVSKDAVYIMTNADASRHKNEFLYFKVQAPSGSGETNYQGTWFTQPTSVLTNDALVMHGARRIVFTNGDDDFYYQSHSMEGDRSDGRENFYGLDVSDGSMGYYTPFSKDHIFYVGEKKNGAAEVTKKAVAKITAGGIDIPNRGSISFSNPENVALSIGDHTSQGGVAQKQLTINANLDGTEADGRSSVFQGGQFAIHYENNANVFEWRTRAANSSSQKIVMNMNNSGQLMIGNLPFPAKLGDGSVSLANYKLFVDGGVLAKEVRVRTSWADYVFDPAYQLRPLSEVELFIKNNKHLPGMQPAAAIEQQGLNIGEIAKQQQEKIEELTLYLIEQKKETDQLRTQLARLEKVLQDLKK